MKSKTISKTCDVKGCKRGIERCIHLQKRLKDGGEAKVVARMNLCSHHAEIIRKLMPDEERAFLKKYLGITLPPTLPPSVVTAEEFAKAVEAWKRKKKLERTENTKSDEE